MELANKEFKQTYWDLNRELDQSLILLGKISFLLYRTNYNMYELFTDLSATASHIKIVGNEILPKFSPSARFYEY